MPSFLIRGLARYFAASIMESRARNYSYTSTPTPKEKEERLSLASWQTDMPWLIPFVQATGYSVVITNSKSHEQITIDPTTKELPPLTLEWLQRYDKQEFQTKLKEEHRRQQQQEQEKKRLQAARLIAKERGQSRFGSNYEPTEADIQEVLNNPNS